MAITHSSKASEETAKDAQASAEAARGVPYRNVEVSGAVVKGDRTLDVREDYSAIKIKSLFTSAGIYPIRVGRDKEGRYAIRVAGLTADEATRIAESLVGNRNLSFLVCPCAMHQRMARSRFRAARSQKSSKYLRNRARQPKK